MKMVMMRIIMIILIKAAKSYNNVRLETRSVRAGENFHSFTVEDWRCWRRAGIGGCELTSRRHSGTLMPPWLARPG